MISYLGSLVQFSPATGRAGRCRQISLCVWGALPVFRPHWVCPVQGCLCFPHLHCSGSRCSIWSVPCIACSSSFQVLHKSVGSVAPSLCLLRPERFRQPEAWVPSPRVRRAFSLHGPSACRRFGLRKSLDRNRRPFCRVGGGGFSGAVCPFPLPPCLQPPAGMGRLFSGVSQSLCFANRQQCVQAC